MRLYTLVFLLFTFNIVSAQISSGGTPWSFDSSYELDSLSSYSLSFNKVVVPKKQDTSIQRSGTLTFAKTFFLNKGSEQDGQWTINSDGSRIWRMKISSEGAFSLNFTFNHFDIPDGAKVFVYSEKTKIVRGAFTNKNMQKSGILAIAPIPGDEVIIEYNEPAEVTYKGLLHISYVGHDFLGVFAKDGQFGRAGACNIDINCDEGSDWQVEKQAICRLVINNADLCTGALINNALLDGEPYVLTANHCIYNQYLAENTVFVFNYESPNCGGSDGSVSQSISGSDLVATKNREQGYLDFTLLKLNKKVPLSYNPYLLGWDASGNQPTNSACIHHPWGDVKKISVDNDPAIQASYVGYGYDPNVFWKVEEWDAGMTQGGSSGSPLINQDKRIVGSLSGGDAQDCDDNPLNDYYQMFSVAYDKYSHDSMQLKHWLDPLNTGILVLDGYKPTLKGGEIEDLIMVSNFAPDDPLAAYVANDGGFVSGNNINQDKKKAEYFDKELFGNRNVISKVHAAFYYAVGNDDVAIEMEILDEVNGLPGNSIGSSTLSLKHIKDNADKDWVTFTFDPPIVISGSVFASLVLPQNEGDSIALMNIDKDYVTVNTAWELNYYEQWYPYSNEELSWNMSTSQVLYLEIGRIMSTHQTISENSFKIYPNPAQDNLTIASQVSNEEIQSVFIFDAIGRIVHESILDNGDNLQVINISSWKEGVYIVKLNTSNGVFTQKLIVN